MSCAVTTAPAHGIRAKQGHAPGNTAPRSGPYPEQGIKTWFVQGHVALGVARQAHTQHLQSENAPHKCTSEHSKTQKHTATKRSMSHIKTSTKRPNNTSTIN